MAIERTHEGDAGASGRMLTESRPIRQLPKKAAKGTVAPRPKVEVAPPTVKVRLVWKSQNVNFVREINRERLQKRALSDDEDDLNDRPQKRRNTRTDESLEQVVLSLNNVAIEDTVTPMDENSAAATDMQLDGDGTDCVEMSGSVHEIATEEERSAPSPERTSSVEEKTIEVDEPETEDQQGNDADNESEDSEEGEEDSESDEGDNEVESKGQIEGANSTECGEDANKGVEVITDERQKEEQDNVIRRLGDQRESPSSSQAEGLPYRHEHKNYDGDSDEDVGGEGRTLEPPQIADGSRSKDKGKQRERGASATAGPGYSGDVEATGIAPKYVYDQLMVDLELKRAIQGADASSNTSDRGEGPSRQGITTRKVVALPEVPAAPLLLRPIARRPGEHVMVPKPPEAYPRLAPLTEEMIRQRNAEELQQRAAEKLQHLANPGMRSRGRVHQVGSGAAQPSRVPRPTTLVDPIRRPSGPRLDRSLSTSPYRLLSEARKLIESDWEKSKAEKKAASSTERPEEQLSEPDLTFGLDGLHIRDEEPSRGAARVRSLLKSALKNSQHQKSKPGRVRFAPRMQEDSPPQVDRVEESNSAADRAAPASITQESSSAVSSTAEASLRDNANDDDGTKTNCAREPSTTEGPDAAATDEQPSTEPHPDEPSRTEEDEKSTVASLAPETSPSNVPNSAQARSSLSSRDESPLTASTSATQETIVDTSDPVDAADHSSATASGTETGSLSTVPAPEPVDAAVPCDALVAPAVADLGSSGFTSNSQPADVSSAPPMASGHTVAGTDTLPQLALTAPSIDSEMEISLVPDASASRTREAAPPYAAAVPQDVTHGAFDIWSAFGAQDSTAQLPPSLAPAEPEPGPCHPSVQWAPPAIASSHLSQQTNGYDGTCFGDNADGSSSEAPLQAALDSVLDPATLYQLACMAAMQGISVGELLYGANVMQQAQEPVAIPTSSQLEDEAWRHNPYHGYVGSDSEVFRIGETDNGTPRYEMVVGRAALYCLHSLIFGDAADDRDWAMLRALPNEMQAALLLWPEPDWDTLESLLAQGPCRVRWEYRDTTEKILSSPMDLDPAVASADPAQYTSDNGVSQPLAAALGGKDAARDIVIEEGLPATLSALEMGQEEPSVQVGEPSAPVQEPDTVAEEPTAVVSEPSVHQQAKAPPSLPAEEPATPATQPSAQVQVPPAMPAYETRVLAPSQPTLVSSPPVCPTLQSPEPVPGESGPGYTLDDITLAVVEVYVCLEYTHCTQPALFDDAAPFPPPDDLPCPTFDEAVRKDLLSVREAERLMREAIRLSQLAR